MLLRSQKRCFTYVVAFNVLWILYWLLSGLPQFHRYSCHFVSNALHNYTWTYPDCPPPLPPVAGAIPAPMWTDKCLHEVLSEDLYGKPDLEMIGRPSISRDTGRVKVFPLNDTCLPFPVEAFPKDGHRGGNRKGDRDQAQSDTDHNRDKYPTFAPNFVKLVPAGWLYGVFAVHDRRIGPFSDVRVFGVSRLPVPGELFCQISCVEHAHAVVSAPALVTSMRVDESHYDSCFWQQFMFTCRVRPDCTPGYASLSKTPCGQVAGILPVLNPYRPKQQIPTPPTFALCLSTISDKRDSDVSYLVEYVETSRHYGVNNIFLYGTYNVSRRYRAVLDVYKAQGYIKIISWDIPNVVNVVYKFAQLLQYSHCVYQNMADMTFLGLTQLEDLLLTTHHRKWSHLFNSINGVTNLDSIASMRLDKQEMCNDDPKRNKVLSDGKATSGKQLELRLVSQHVYGELSTEHTHIIQPKGIVLPLVYSTVMMVRGWKSMEVSSADALVYSFNYKSRLCSKVNSRSISGVTLCKELPVITRTVVHNLHMLDLINNKNRKISSQDQICVQ